MRIKSLTLHGFKSFADRTHLELHDGITAVVGPNGCGKSNISDALRWVLGEQRPTAIRGSRMEEAIFGGTESRRPIQRAEVTLELSNTDGALPVPYSHVKVGRTVYRGGDSEYALNGAPCRLMDIQDLCRDTGLGANAYAMMEAKMIDRVLSDRAEERRALFEEAAGIGRYKDRRRLATRRLEQAETDLQRLDDVLGEVRSKVRSLAQQRGRAERYARLRVRLLQLEVAVAEASLERGRRRLQESEAKLVGLRETHPGEEAQLRTAETETETLRIQHAELEHERADVARQLEVSRQNVETRERERLIASERVAASGERIRQIEQELAEIESQQERLVASLEEWRSGVERATSELEQLESGEAARTRDVEAAAGAHETGMVLEEASRKRFEALLREIGQIETEIRTADERAAERSEELERRSEALDALDRTESELREALAQTLESGRDAENREARLSSDLEARREALDRSRTSARALRERVAKLEGEAAGARARADSLSGLLAAGSGIPETVSELVKARDQIPGIGGVLADYVQASSEVAGAIESHLGAYLHAIIVRDWRTVEHVRAWLEKRDGGAGVTLLPLEPGPRAGDGAGGGGVSLPDGVRTSGDGAPWVRALLGGLALETGGTLRPSAAPWVSHDGTGQDRWGAVRLGRPTSERGLLRTRAALEAARETLQLRQAELETVRRELEREEAALAETIASGDELERQLREETAEGRRLAAEREAIEAKLKRLSQEREEFSGRVEALRVSRGNASDRAHAHHERLAALKEQVEQSEADVKRLREQVETARSAWEQKRLDLHELQLLAARQGADASSARDRLQRGEDGAAELANRYGRLVSEREAQEETIRRGESAVVQAEQELASWLERRSDLEARLREAEETLQTGREDLQRRETSLRERRRTEREHADLRHSLELEVTELRATEIGVRERLAAEWDATLEELKERVEAPEEGDPDAWQEELEGLRRSILRIGPVNLLAEEEFVTETERLEFLDAQRDDLVEACDNLRESIRRINRTAAETFETSFEQIRENFQRTFRTLFEGGQCDVWLEDSDDPLDSPIEISASPRGKRTQRIHLLSGGERALTALALLFAIYLAKPSPFCLMDEVDAPLDETNILRFVNMLREFKDDTQFIIITHNPQTIEAADWVYGVTMQEPGVSSIVGVELGTSRVA